MDIFAYRALENTTGANMGNLQNLLFIYFQTAVNLVIPLFHELPPKKQKNKNKERKRNELM